MLLVAYSKLEADVKRLKSELQSSRCLEQELRSQIASLSFSDRTTKSELYQLRQENENLQSKYVSWLTFDVGTRWLLVNCLMCTIVCCWNTPPDFCIQVFGTDLMQFTMVVKVGQIGPNTILLLMILAWYCGSWLYPKFCWNSAIRPIPVIALWTASINPSFWWYHQPHYNTDTISKVVPSWSFSPNSTEKLAALQQTP